MPIYRLTVKKHENRSIPKSRMYPKAWLLYKLTLNSWGFVVAFTIPEQARKDGSKTKVIIIKNCGD